MKTFEFVNFGVKAGTNQVSDGLFDSGIQELV